VERRSGARDDGRRQDADDTSPETGDRRFISGAGPTSE
jgi:hypothetical protein